MPGIPLMIDYKTTVYHVRDVEPISPAIFELIKSCYKAIIEVRPARYWILF
jgi:hypothetical protein